MSISSFYTRNKFFLTIFGRQRNDIVSKLSNYLSDNVIITNTDLCTYIVNNIYNTGLPDKPIIYESIELLLHGIVFPYDVTLDEFSEQPERKLQEMISKHRNDLSRLPYSIRNGSYCGVAYNETNDEFYAFTCFLNSIPIYYAFINNCLIVGTDLCLIAQLLGLELKLSQGLIEYYILGTNLSDKTAFDQIKTIPKGGYLKYKAGSITVDYYYTMPEEKANKKFDDYVNEFAYLWEENVNALHSEKFNYGLGLTGGIDSRLILSAMKNRDKPVLFTGSHPDHPDYLIAKKITSSLGLNNHYLEDYRYVDRLTGYAEFCSMADNPLLANTIHTHQQMLFRKKQGLVYELSGAINLYGGEHYYSDRRSLKDTILRSITLPNTRVDNSKEGIYNVVNKLVRNMALYDDLLFYSQQDTIDFWLNIEKIYYTCLKQIGSPVSEEFILERLRHIYKSTNLLSWNCLAGRRYDECISPEMNISLTNFACSIPLKYRDSRRILLAYLKRYHPETAKFVLSGYIFNANSPWFIYKGLSNYIKAFNVLGYKIPFLQWYIKHYSFPDLGKQPEISKFQKSICTKSNIITETPLCRIFEKYSNDPIRLMRLFNIVLLKMRLEMGEDNLKDYLIDDMNIIRDSMGPKV